MKKIAQAIRREKVMKVERNSKGHVFTLHHFKPARKFTWESEEFWKNTK